MRAALAQKDVVDGLAVMGLEATSSTPEQLTKNLKESYDRWGPIVKKIALSRGLLRSRTDTMPMTGADYQSGVVTRC